VVGVFTTPFIVKTAKLPDHHRAEVSSALPGWAGTMIVWWDETVEGQEVDWRLLTFHRLGL
jgi:hypothetical protein